MNNPETIIRGIMQEAAKDAITKLAANHIGIRNPTVSQVEAHFAHDEKAAKKIKKLANKAGFVIWGDEPWGPGKGNIDWSSDYD